MVCILKYKLNNLTYKYTKQSTQENAIENIPLDDKGNNYDINDCLNLCFDKLANRGDKLFLNIPLFGGNTIQNLSVILEEDTHIYEWIIITRPVKMYFDLEMEIPNLSLTDSSNILKTFIDITLIEINNLFDIQIEATDIITLNSSKVGKLSYHLIVNSNIYFKNTLDHGIFIKWLNIRFTLLNGLTEYVDVINMLKWCKTNSNGTTEQRYIFDDKAYITGQKFRCINQSKKGSNRPLLLESQPLTYLTDSLVGIYPIDGINIPYNYRLLNVDILVIPDSQVKKTKKQTQKIQTRETTMIDTTIYDNEGYIIKGKALMNTLTNVDAIQKMTKANQYLHLIPNYPSQSYEMFNKIRHHYFHNGGTKKYFIEWWKISPTYNGDKNQLTIFDKQRDPNINLNFLKKCAYKSQPEYFYSQSPLLDAYYNPVYTKETDVINENSYYVSQEGTEYENDILHTNNAILLNADMGSGKSRAIQRLIPLYKRVLILTPRITYTKHIAHEFRVGSYLDGNFTEDKIACSVESLYKLPNDDYDLIVIDEAEACLCIFSSPTLRGKELQTYKKLYTMIQNSKKIILAGAFITQKTVDFIESFDNKKLLVINHTRQNVPRKKAVKFDEVVFNLKLMDYLERGGKPYVYFDSKTKAEVFVNMLKGKAHNNLFFTNILNNIIYYRSGGDDDDLNLLDDINITWGNASFVIATPCITVGNSYCPENTTFTSVWINFYPTCIVADTFQGHKRVRFTTTNTLYYCIPSKKLLKLIAGGSGDILKSMVEYDAITRQKRKIIGTHAIEERDIINKLLKDTKKAIQWLNNNKHLPERYNNIVDAVSVDYTDIPIPFKRLLLNNLNESVLSRKYFKSMVETFVDRCGYDNSGYIKSTTQDNERTLGLEATAESNEDEYAHIKTITETEYDEINILIKRKECTEKQKKEVEKYIFDKYINMELSLAIRSYYYDLYIDKYKRDTLNNLYNEATRKSSDMFFNMLEDTKPNKKPSINMLEDKKPNKKTSVKMLELIKETKPLRLHTMRHIMGLLGMENSLDGVEISNETLLITSQYIEGNREKLHAIFGIKDITKKDNKYNISYRGICFLNKIFRYWCFGAFIEKQTEINKKKVLSYTLQSRYTGNNPYIFNLTIREESLDEPIPLTGVNPSLKHDFLESGKYDTRH